MKTRVYTLLLAAFCLTPLGLDAEQWSVERANEWSQSHPFIAGANFVPSTAINQLEMWQADTFDLETVDRELGWAQSIGFNSMRVFLHNLLWQEDPLGFLDRMDQFLKVADKHNIKIMFVLFDSVWNPYPQLGKQPEPHPHRHNSGWVQAPGEDYLRNLDSHGALESYVKGVLTRFADDDRVLVWDLINEPNNTNPPYSRIGMETPHREELALILLREAFAWAREVNPSQPITSGVWTGTYGKDQDPGPANRFMLKNSDIITFHSYAPLDRVKEDLGRLREYGRPLMCTEYMARPQGSTFQAVLPYFKENNIGAYNWGLVAGKSQTQYPWDSWTREYDGEPELWFHDVFRGDGTPYIQEEVQFLKILLLPGRSTTSAN